jgi:thiamine-phosphate pyrophosphorylase
MIKSLITDPEHYSRHTSCFLATLTQAIQTHRPEMVTFRDKNIQNPQKLIAAFVSHCKHLKIKYIFVNSYLDLAKKYHATGIHLTSKQFHLVKKAKSMGLQVAISTHTQSEVNKAIRLGVNFVYFSPIFTTPGKGKPKGLEELKRVSATMRVKIIALGGITTPRHIDAIQECKADGFASIRYFLKEKNGF